MRFSVSNPLFAVGVILCTDRGLTVYRGEQGVIRDDTPYGCILTQGQGTVNGLQAEASCMLRYGQASADEFFVSYDAASKGVVVKNTSLCEPLVMLKHFPWYPAVPAAEAEG